MSESIKYALKQELGDYDRLKVMYLVPTGYADLSFDVEAEIENSTPSNNTGQNRGLIRTLLTGSDPVKYGAWVNGGSGDLNQSHIQITGSIPLSFKDSSCIVEFVMKEKRTDLLLGSFEKEEITVDGSSLTGVRGLNFGVNDRGHLFANGADINGEYFLVADQIELADKNIVSFSLGDNRLDIARFDYFNQRAISQTFSLDTSVIRDPTGIYVGGSPSFLGLSDTGLSSQHNDSFYLNSLLIFSGSLPPSSLYNIGSGLVSTYSINSGDVSSFTRTTGYSDFITYHTGITGYSVIATGTRNLPSGAGVPIQTGSYNTPVVTAAQEGDQYFIYHDLGSGFYKEKVGLLTDSNFGLYEPTGQMAHSTLGLQDASQNITNYTDDEGVFNQAGSAPLFGLLALTGITDEISGVVSMPLTETVYETGIASSGLTINVSSLGMHKKNSIYYLDKRP
jgi:hypothetical protein